MPFVLAVIATAPSMQPRDVLAMDAMLALELIGARLRHLAGAAAARPDPRADGTWTNNADGSRTMHIRSLDTLKSILAGGR